MKSVRQSPPLRWALAATAAALLLAGAAAARDAAVPGEPPMWPLPPEPARVRYVSEFRSARDLGRSGSLLGRIARGLVGARGSGELGLARPADVYAPDSTQVFVTDASGSKLFLFDYNDRSVRVLGTEGDGALSKPMGLGGDRSEVYVTDPPSRRVVVFDLDGHFLRAFGGPGALLNPVDVAVDPASHRAWVVDSYLHQVVVFDSAGVVLRRIGKTVAEATTKESEWRSPVTGHETGGSERGSHDVVENRGGGNGEFLYPCSIARSPEGHFHVVDGLNGRVQSFDQEGTFLSTFGRLGDTPGSLPRPKGIACDSDSNIYLVDAAFNNLQIFNGRGELLLAVGGLGQAAGRFWLPLGLHIDSNDRIYVADRYNGRVQILQYLRPHSALGGDPVVMQAAPRTPVKEEKHE
ncbi:MAG: hypothetical protein HZB25_09650 [Candidatus Eisenbacteria bacterium]|nr:hypothetical protein [Candidatus Eisenbacteria bacterium]